MIKSFSERLDPQTKLYFIKIDLPERFKDRISNLKFYKFVNSIKEIKELVGARVMNFEDPEINDGKNDCYRIDKKGMCDLKKNNQYIVLWDGRITTCLKDFNGEMCVGNIDDLDNLNYKNKECPWKK